MCVVGYLPFGCHRHDLQGVVRYFTTLTEALKPYFSWLSPIDSAMYSKLQGALAAITNDTGRVVLVASGRSSPNYLYGIHEPHTTYMNCDLIMRRDLAAPYATIDTNIK